MSLLQNLKSDSTIANERDSVGGGGLFESGLYPFKVALAYLETSPGGALALSLSLKNADGKELRTKQWMTSGKAKGCLNYYTDKDSKKQYLPGFNLANSLALLTVGKEISELDTEDKVVKLYSYEAKAEVPTKVAMVTDLLGQDILVGVIKQTVDKTAKNEATGEYTPTGETRDENEVDKFFRARDRMTTAEIRASAETATFADTWTAKWDGVVRNKATGAVGTAGAPKAAAANSGTKKPQTSLFAA